YNIHKNVKLIFYTLRSHDNTTEKINFRITINYPGLLIRKVNISKLSCFRKKRIASEIKKPVLVSEPAAMTSSNAAIALPYREQAGNRS
ncbi:MAG: hypothetical protein JXQ30_02400, partial [Spirochaetes bacterium]|nr:hypothetical protein [Spirochaetota bacterium]